MSEPKVNEFLIGGTVGVVKGRWQGRVFVVCRVKGQSTEL